MNTNSVGVVVLNYVNYQQTIVCVEGILSQDIPNLPIIIVENGSSNESWDELSARFSDNPRITLIQSEDNLGYARGNNLGIRTLHKMGKDFIVVANSDVVLDSSSIIRQILEGYEPGVGLIVPIIRNPNGMIEQRVLIKRPLIRTRIVKAALSTSLRSIIRFREKSKAASNDFYSDNVSRKGLQENEYTVSGSMFVLTPDFFSNYAGLFPETFLFFEEWATILLLHKAGLKTKVVSNDPVLHLGGASTPENVTSDHMAKAIIQRSSAFKVVKLAFLPAPIVLKKYGTKE